MKNKIHSLRLKLACLALITLNSALSTVQAQGTAFTYQGQLTSGGSPANGLYDFQFSLFYAPSGGTGGQAGNTLAVSAVGVTNGLFTTTLDFGHVFTGSPLWLAVSVCSNGVGSYAALTPYQPLAPAPYAVFANAAGNVSGTVPASQLSGTVANSQLAHNSITVNAGTGLAGGGTVALGGSTTLNNTGVLSVTGNGDITAATAGGAVTLGSTASSGNIAGAIIKRDGNGNFGASTITLSGSLELDNPGQNTAVGSGALGNNTTGIVNTASGANALLNNTTGFYNTANGTFALYENTNGYYDTANGASALYCNASGYQNTADGAFGLYLNTAGNNNTASGAYTLFSNTNGNNNTGDGQQALYSNTSGNNNVALGYQAGYNLTTGNSNIEIGNTGVVGDNNTIRIGSGQTNTIIAGISGANAVGGAAVYVTPSGQLGTVNAVGNNYNTAIGASALGDNTTGYQNTADGAYALGNNTAGYQDTASGAYALAATTTGSDNTANGTFALYENTTGAGNTASGAFALLFNTTGSNNVALGYQAGWNLTTGSSNIDIGNTGAAGDNNTIRIGSGQTNTLIAGISGANAMGGAAVYVTASGQLGTVNSLGYDNMANGAFALGNNTTGYQDTASGAYALAVNTTGANNTANGALALYENIGGAGNTANGALALFSNTSGNSNTASGLQALGNNTTGANNTASGAYALYYSPIGSRNTASGAGALGQLGQNGAGGSNNIALGFLAGSSYTGNESGNIDIGNTGAAAENYTIRIGTPGVQTAAYIAGVINGNGGGLTNLNVPQVTISSAATPPANAAPILNMVWILPGTFIMGSPASEEGRSSDETQHVVTLTNGFWMAQHLVTQGEYLAVTGSNPSSFTGDLTHPVESVTWINATNYCHTLTQNEQSAGRLPAGWVYRLPTEAEWEYCCRALTTSRFYYGNDPSDSSLANYAWYSANSSQSTQPVGQLLANPWGLADMAGNVWEWCQDWYGAYPGGSVTNPQGAGTGTGRVVRGGSWEFPWPFCRSAQRENSSIGNADPGTGFRVVLAPGQ